MWYICVRVPLVVVQVRRLRVGSVIVCSPQIGRGTRWCARPARQACRRPPTPNKVIVGHRGPALGRRVGAVYVVPVEEVLVVCGWWCARVVCGLVVVKVDQVLAVRRSPRRPAGHSGRMLCWASVSEERGFSTTSCTGRQCVVCAAVCWRVAEVYGVRRSCGASS